VNGLQVFSSRLVGNGLGVLLLLWPTSDVTYSRELFDVISSDEAASGNKTRGRYRETGRLRFE